MQALRFTRVKIQGAAAAAALVLVLSQATGVAAEPAASISVGDGTELSAFQFEPASVQVNPGDTITWTNTGSQVHTITAPDGSFDSGALKAGDSFSIVFSAPGTYAYTCFPHPWMKGTIVVGSGE